MNNFYYDSSKLDFNCQIDADICKQMRLIDADELKFDLKRYFTEGTLDGVSAKLVFNQILHDIDNAPTVEPNDTMFKEWFCPDCGERKNSFKEGYKRAILDGKTNFPRPQGEWLYPLYDTVIGKRRRGKAEKQCSVCKQIFSNNLPWDARFCPSCGANNGGNKNEDPDK